MGQATIDRNLELLGSSRVLDNLEKRLDFYDLHNKKKKEAQ